jgi:hypothetical protein
MLNMISPVEHPINIMIGDPISVDRESEGLYSSQILINDTVMKQFRAKELYVCGRDKTCLAWRRFI